MLCFIIKIELNFLEMNEMTFNFMNVFITVMFGCIIFLYLMVHNKGQVSFDLISLCLSKR